MAEANNSINQNNMLVKIRSKYIVIKIFENLKENRLLKLIHYNMANKPWHFDDVLYQEYFWKYAKETPFYKDLLKTKDNYPEDKKKKDALVIENLTELAKKESSCIGDDRKNNKRWRR